MSVALEHVMQGSTSSLTASWLPDKFKYNATGLGIPAGIGVFGVSSTGLPTIPVVCPWGQPPRTISEGTAAAVGRRDPEQRFADTVVLGS